MVKGKVAAISLSVVSIALLSFSLVGMHNNFKGYDTAAKEAKISQNKADKAKADYMAKDQKVNNQAMRNALDSNDPILKSVATQNMNYTRVTNISNDFFKTYYAFSDTKSYLARKDKLSNLITPELANNKAIFDDGKDSTGGDYIKALGLQSELVKTSAYMTQSKDNRAQALVKVVNRAWHKGQKENSALATHYYDLTLDTKSNKITSLKQVLYQKGANINEE